MSAQRSFESHADRALAHIRSLVIVVLSLELWGSWPGGGLAIAINLGCVLLAGAWGAWRSRDELFAPEAS